MKNTITLEQYKKLEAVTDAFLADNHQTCNEAPVLLMLTTGLGDGPEPEETAEGVSFEAYDYDGNTDFGTLQSLLNEAGIDIDLDALESPFVIARMDDEEPRPAYWNEGDAQFIDRRGTVRLYGYWFPLKREG